MKLRIHGTGTLAEIFGDAVVYRLLEPADPRIPGLTALRDRLGLEPAQLPRKSEPEYGRVVAEMLREGARVLAGFAAIDALVVIGDTELNDGGAFVNTSSALGCPGAAFICAETLDDERLDSEDLGAGRRLWRANRWNLVDTFMNELDRRGMTVGPGTAVLVDIDKTALGARGRNHLPIDSARVEAVLRTARGRRGRELDETGLLRAYERFNRPRFHPFTSDNQDYLAYIALLVETGWIDTQTLEDRVGVGEISTFDGLLDSVSADRDRLPDGFRRIHDDVVRAAAAGDPTPFKTFRVAEYLQTVHRMRPSERPGDIGELLADRLTVTAEVWRAVRSWSAGGAFVLGLSDKPDEASTPCSDLAAAGYRPLHRTEALIVGEAW
jgi:hypothetical protein